MVMPAEMLSGGSQPSSNLCHASVMGFTTLHIKPGENVCILSLPPGGRIVYLTANS